MHCRGSGYLAGYLACLLTLAAAGAAAAADIDTGAKTEEEKKSDFTIPPQPLGDALLAFSRLRQQTVLFNPALVAGLSSPAVNGRLAPAEAMARLLQDSGLEATHTEQGWLVRTAKSDSADPPADIRDDPPLEEVVATGEYRRSLQSALALKRDADQHLDILLSGEIGKSPGGNIADALGRNTGVSVVRDRGQALFVSIRGLPTRFNRLTLNGNPVATNENVRTSGQYGRQFHFDTLPPELVSAVEVKKSPRAADDEGSIGGSVNIRTFRPLDIGHNKLDLHFSAGESRLAQRRDPHFSLIANWVNTAGDLGIFLAGTRSRLNLRQDRVMNFGWQQLGAEQNPFPGREGALMSPGSIRPTLEQERRERSGLSFAVQRESESGTAWALNFLQLQQDIDYREYSYSADYDIAALNPDSIGLRGEAIVTGATDAGSVQIGRETAGLVDLGRALDFTLEGDWNRDWSYTLSAAASDAESYNDDPIRRTRLQREDNTAIGFELPGADSERLPQLDYPDLSLLDAAAFPGRRLEWRRNDTRDSNYSAALSTTRDIDRGFISNLQTGIKMQRRMRDYRRTDAIITGGIEGEYFPPDHFGTLAVDDFLSSADSGLPQQWLVPDESLFWRHVDADTIADNLLSEQNRVNSYSVDETVGAAYAQLDLDGAGWRGNIGLRYAETRHRARGHRLDSRADTAEPVSHSARYGQLLPAANLAVELPGQSLWRIGAARTLKRPDLQDLAPRLTLNSGEEKTAEGGNPQLNAVTAWQLDTGIEFYLPGAAGTQGGMIGVGAFYKSLDGFIHRDIAPAEIDGETYKLTTRVNGGRAQVSGLELDYRQNMHWLPPPWNRLGAQANLTLSDSRAHYQRENGTVQDQLEDVARRTFNFGIFYDSPKLTSRLQYSWRDDSLSEPDDGNRSARNSRDFGTLDAYLSLSLNDHIGLFLEGINLTGAAEREYVTGGEFAGYSYYGRRISAGVKLHFE
ncbi:TonB-dependent receptor [Microbulbifer halophilus]|uniref:TonB-dependent receptor n=1 Tax=Microbulbifer halophilus TaxID=453963 RepID=A0ABW5EA44_9GAMM|nr:TonB-dependent receptor [Microbulbifer halophilus]MCW8126462.1 TonB-dependent receptor [Microbulbifer halophilus]